MASPDEALRWLAVLEAIEADTERAEAGVPLLEWRRPVDMPDFPPELLPRMQAVLAAQEAVLARAIRARAEIGRRLAALRSAQPASGQRMPVYLDALG